ncbi:ATP-binding cassette domain-containing protein [Rhodopirellula baltica]|uniref:Sodium ABC transporter ATP-binding protein n=4 Tax=Rhodopirellula baltica TaxID=265606 RepID=F2APT5_RHOBT|nr:ATP-binding cassette domain-containing protein [Rhodopirellula baltica]EGF28352.1 sodium ABC transporter ATP-binding protein [Rhodopirellula baltica WH47]EKK03234.1 ABC transporter (ATP-binding protein)-putative sodium extrusion ABC transporter [Rhodopirellula baltica SH28]ELP34816.1 ABC transporter (ATP-binding protein)-putative sodium extrusion ABC transporter [Rhodopirellula baltica SWK14]CAD75481.1 ABC transporter (ATP-binding protein)-putative sodium extrusion ABC transporter [Rhodopire
MIHVQHLTKAYEDLRRGRFLAVDHISFCVQPGEIFGLLGPNGAGKTTVLRILSTVLRPSSGIATIDGYDVSHEPAEVRRRIGFVSNNTAIYDRMTAWEMVGYFGRLHGMQRDELNDRLEKLFSQLRMNEFRDVPGSKMSTGMQQKVSIARALVHDPPVLIFDEATLGLDVLVARNLLEVIRELREAGKCLIFSTHIMSEVERLCDRIAIMHRGRILDSGTLNELVDRHEEENFEELFFSLLSEHETAETNEQNLASGNYQPPTETLATTEVVQ